MSIIEKLSVAAVRNINSLDIEPIATVNILHGENGSGKTSILESIHLLASGRSFRTSKLDPLINSEKDEAVVFDLFLGKTYIGFKEALGFNESTGNYASINRYGYLGKYQFAATTLSLIGVYNTHAFLANAALQEKAFIANTSRNKWILRRDIKRFVGTKINNVLVTESGILAAAHLAGAGNVKKYLRSDGNFFFKDAFGTTIHNYLKKFSGYDTSSVTPNIKAKAV